MSFGAQRSRAALIWEGVRKMVKLSWTRLVGAGGGLALLLITGTSVASAEPNVDFGPVINTTCNYPQAVAALNAQAPELANELSSYPVTPSWMRTFLAAPVDQRREMLQQAQSSRVVQHHAGHILQIAKTCDNY
jgi:hemophore-related protein